ncbi:MAG: thiamine diphosphokinase [Lachnospiraceae bacterium]|nr:thiamine diphosphokinase [Lachnospiraceae bacterium]
MKRCVIISGGEYSPSVKINENDYIIACDKGYEYALKMGAEPDLVIGDFDSLSAETVPKGTIRLPREKDVTDTFAGVSRALDMGFEEIVICCALGKRADHELANYQTAAYAAGNGARVRIDSGDNAIYFLPPGVIRIPKQEGWALSVLSFTDKCEGVTISGTKYKLESAVLTNTFPLGTSNEWESPEAVISHESGILTVIRAKL